MRRIPIASALLLAMAIAIGCAPGATPTPTLESTTPTPPPAGATPSPAATSTPIPRLTLRKGEALYLDPVRGFSLVYPESWKRQETEDTSPVLILQAPGGTPMLLVTRESNAAAGNSYGVAAT